MGMQTSLRGGVRVSATSAWRSHQPGRARALAPSNRGAPMWTSCRLTRGSRRCEVARYSVPCHISWTMIIGAAFADSEGWSNRPVLVSIKHPPVRVLQRSFLKPENCAARGQIFAIAAGEKRPPTPVALPPEGTGIVECRSLIGQDPGKASSAGDVPCRHAHMAWSGGQWSPYEPMTLSCRRIGWVPLWAAAIIRTCSARGATSCPSLGNRYGLPSTHPAP